MYRAVIECCPELGMIEGWIEDIDKYRPWRETMVCHFRNLDPLCVQFFRLSNAGMLTNYHGIMGRLDDAVAECWHKEKQSERWIDRVMALILGRPEL